jgi:hypothetical protein
MYRVLLTAEATPARYAAVWQQDLANVLRVQRYFFFQTSQPETTLRPGQARARGPQEDEDAVDNQLQDIAAVLLRLHGTFYEADDLEHRDVRTLLQVMKSQTLSGCRIVFSRVRSRLSDRSLSGAG